MSKKDSSFKPNLDKKISVKDFLEYYWLKEDLLKFCSDNSLPVSGSKFELIERIKYFLSGDIQKLKGSMSKKSNKKDSDNNISLESPVIHYRNDSKTKNFFVKHIGNHFKFNDYLRQFKDVDFCMEQKLKYKDLVIGWKKSEEEKKEKGFRSKISSQFEYMQFIRDFFDNESGKSKEEAIAAWHFIKQFPNKRTYIEYKKQKNKK